MEKPQSAVRAALPHTLPVLAGYLFLGAAYGILMSAKGFGIGWTVGISLVTYAGSMQFVMIGLLTSAFAPAYAFLLALMVNARHLFYGVSMLGRFAGLGWRKWLLVFGLTDETFSIHCAAKAPDGVDPGRFMLSVSLLDHSYWLLGSALGGLAGGLFAFDTTGIDFVMTALFVVIFLDQWKQQKRHGPAFIGLGASVFSLCIFGPDGFLLPAMALILAGITFIGRRPEQEARP